MDKEFYKFGFKILAAGLICLFCLIALNTLSVPENILSHYTKVEPQVSCEGIEGYIDGNWIESRLLLTGKFYASNATSENEMFNAPMIPAQLGEEYYDCEDLSHAILCLASEYNKTCKAYYGIKYKQEPEAHIGVECQTSNGKWIEVF